MRRYLGMVVLLFLAGGLHAQGWVQRADIQGDVTDILVAAWNGSTGHIFAATNGSGVYYSTDGICWQTRSNGLTDLQVTAIAARWENTGSAFQGRLMAATVSGKVFLSNNYGTNWYPASLGLNLIQDSFIPTDLSVVWDQAHGTYYTYMSTLGAGMLRQTGWGTTAQWAAYNSSVVSANNKYLLCVAALTQGTTTGAKHRIIAGTLNNGGGTELYYAMDPNDGLQMVSQSQLPSGVSILSVAFHELTFALVGLSTDSSGTGYGVYTSDGSLGTWTPVCSDPPDQGIWAVDYTNMGTYYRITAGTRRGLWTVDDPSNCGSPAYEAFPGFRGAIRTLAHGSGTAAWAGGPGKGPLFYSPSSPSSGVSNRRCNFYDYNILDIAPSPYFSNGDWTIYTASGVGGVYKNRDFIEMGSSPVGYFFRMVGDPDSWGTVPVLAVETDLNYLEGSCSSATSTTVYAGTFGRGVIRSDDGGRSWVFANGDGDQLAGTIVTDLVMVPPDGPLLAAVYNQGVYRSYDGGRSWSQLGSIANKQILSLAAAEGGSQPWIYAGCRPYDINNTSDIDQKFGLFRFDLSQGWQRVGQTYFFNKSVTAIGLPPSYNSHGYLYVGTEANGVFFGRDYGMTNDDFFDFNGTSQTIPPKINDLKVSPSWDSYVPAVLIAAEPSNTSNGGVYVTVDTDPSSEEWTQANLGLPSDRRVQSVAFAPGYPNNSLSIFCGHATQGLFTARWDYGNGFEGWDQANGFLNVPPDITGIAAAPDDASLLFATSRYEGVFISRDGGDTFQPWGANLTYYDTTAGKDCPIPEMLSIAVTNMDPGMIYMEEKFDAAPSWPSGWYAIDGGSCTGAPQYTWNTYDYGNRNLGSPLQAPYAIIDSDNQGSGCTQNDALYSPSIDTRLSEQLWLEFDHIFTMFSGYGSDIAEVWVKNPSTGYWYQVPGAHWDEAGGSSSGHVAFDISAYIGNGTQFLFQYWGAYDYLWAVDNVTLYSPASDTRRVVVGTRGHGIYYADHTENQYFGDFTPSNIETGSVNEVRFISRNEDMRAAHVPNGDLHSADLGVTWDTVSGIPAGWGLTDVSFSDGLKRALNGFTWGCSSGKQVAPTRGPGDCIGSGAAWYYQPSFGAWQECDATIPDPCEDFRAIKELDSGTVLLGSIGVGSGAPDIYTEGIYRLDTSCSAVGAAWEPASEGLPTYPGGQNAGKVTAFYQDPVDHFILAAVSDAYLTNGDDGGVYYSDVSSDGRAWVKTDLPAADPASYDLSATSGGTTIYTGLTGDGIWSSLPGDIGVLTPSAYFECATGACEVCLGSSTTFYNYSAGNVTSQSWNFGDGIGSSVLQSPSYTYTGTGAFDVSLSVTNAYGTDPTPFERTFTVKGELDWDTDLPGEGIYQVTYNSGTDTLTLYWTDLDGESGYSIWVSNTAASRLGVVATTSANVTSRSLAGASNNYTFYRIQANGSGYVCGAGPVGGTW
ncbi:MAG TPA: PKD domain-containing protein [Thermoanaerobaculia bacterium]|nr:PKD domain-containing protein [Thermoanaerobaculia bacterium]HUM29560.1 PKD domain-containing protein [Thermoanaerobaculia bacterium]HXK67943.1 PKD domain-containing protein [Thermoanaerobaculia bacterium]